MNIAYDAVLMVGFGGPTRPEDIRPFLDNVVRGRPVPPERLEEVAQHYHRIGGRSPYNDLTLKQADALRALLAGEGLKIPVYVGMRNWAPYVGDVMREMAAGGARRIFCFVLAPHRSEASWERYRQTVAEALAVLGPDPPAVDYPLPWHEHPLFIRAVATGIEDAMDDLGADSPHVIFTAHSIPAAMDADSGYSAQIAQSCRLVARELDLTDWSIAYQSRSGNPREPWLEPDVGSVLKGLGGRAAVICDHVEVLYDLDVEAAAIARAGGVTMVRAPTVGAHPLFIEMIASLLRHGAARGGS
jgi:ferrochelatase